jgi:hypothetical protein
MEARVSLRDMYDDQQLRKLVNVYKKHSGSSSLHKQLVTAISPMMPDVNRRLGQENDPGYIAYMTEYMLDKTSSS